MPTHGRSALLRASCTGRANVTHTPPRQNTLALPTGLSVTLTTPGVYYLSAAVPSFGTAFFPRKKKTVFPALTASSCRRRVQHGGGELLALLFSLTSRHRLARESTAPKFYVFAQLCLLVHHHNSLRPSSVNTTPGLSKVSHSQLGQLHADKIMTFRHPTIA